MIKGITRKSMWNIGCAYSYKLYSAFNVAAVSKSWSILFSLVLKNNQMPKVEIQPLICFMRFMEGWKIDWRFHWKRYENKLFLLRQFAHKFDTILLWLCLLYKRQKYSPISLMWCDEMKCSNSRFFFKREWMLCYLSVRWFNKIQKNAEWFTQEWKKINYVMRYNDWNRMYFL